MCILKKPPSYGKKFHVLVDTRKSDNGSDDYGQNSNKKIWNTNPGRFETCGPNYQTKLNSVALVRERTIPTERPPPVGEVSANFCG